MYLKAIFTCIITIVLFTANLIPIRAADSGMIILCYHDVVQKPYNAFTVTPAMLKEHLEYLKNNGYHPISYNQYVAACKQGEKLPDKPVLLTFDDGYQSFYTEVYPLLKEYNYPAVFAIVTSWSEYAPSDVGTLLTWPQIREMEQSGLVTIASHSHQAHRGTLSNPQGDRGNMLETMQYINGQYESMEVYRQRVKQDFLQTQAVFEKELGHKVTAMVWPYGAYTNWAIDLGREAGFEVFFGLDGGFNQPNEKGLSDARRGIIENKFTGEKFAKFMKDGAYKFENKSAAQLDIDLIYNPRDARETEHNISLAVDRFNAAGINTVFLQAFSDTEGTGNIESVYFYTKEAPVKADIFSHIASRLRNEGFQVYAWMPTLACQWLLRDGPENAVLAYEPKGKGWYNRATPFSPAVEARLERLYSDLAAYSYIDGVLFQDDLYLTDYEDFSPAAKKVFYSTFGLELTPEVLQDDKIRTRWIQLKTDTLTNLTLKLVSAMRQYRPYLATARNLYPSIITEPDSEAWFAQNYQQYLAAYDYTVIMAYPYLEKQDKQPLVWLEHLAGSALKDQANARKTIFKLQTYDWNKKRWLSEKELTQQMTVLKQKNAVNFAFYPENVFSE